MKKKFQIFVALFFISIVVFLLNATLFTNTLTNQSEKLSKPPVEAHYIQATNDYILSGNYIANNLGNHDQNLGESLTDEKKQIQKHETRSNSVALSGLLPILAVFFLLFVNLDDIGDGELNFQNTIGNHIQNQIDDATTGQIYGIMQ